MKRVQTPFFAIGCSLFLFVGACGPKDETVNFTFTLDYTNSDVAALLANDKPTTVRLGYTYTGFTRENIQQIKVFPQAAIPTTVPVGESSAFEWSTASDAGISTDDGVVTFSGLPLNKKGMEIFIEILQKFSDGGWYVVSYYCYSGPADEELSAAQLEADTSVARRVIQGRTCGRCAKVSALTLSNGIPTPCP